MSHQDKRTDGTRYNSVYLMEALQWMLVRVRWDVQFRKDCRWTPRWLVSAALLWAWSAETNLTDRFRCAQRLVIHLQAGDSMRITSYQAFLKLLRRWTTSLVRPLRSALRTRMQSFEKDWLTNGFVVFGVDGSRLAIPRTESNESVFSAARIRKRKQSSGQSKKRRTTGAEKKAQLPQMWVTVMYHVGLHLPWDWRIGACDSSERRHAQEMAEHLPDKALLTGDAGFVGYDFTRCILAAGCDLLVRVGANVQLLKKLGYVRESGDTVYVWPEKAVRDSKAPLVFRLIRMQGPRHPIYLLTSVLDRDCLSNDQLVDIYKARWGVEVFYRDFKQTFGRRKLRSHNACNARLEVEWSLVGLWAMLLYATSELACRGIPISRLSVAQTLRSFRMMATDYLHPANPGRTLRILLRNCLIDTYARQNRKSRDCPRKKKKDRPPGKPIIKKATKRQRTIAKQIKQQNG